ncbi:hypothetical protein WJX73_008599 [Symbiochloris irregularis]|uniref:tRNA/rRNA methyltransferase SpoU type domain-containing protein n=1 Tax=Symbiochloris irregularis TaxID=706552 RepID=A0AAW1P5K0_9CHLO
MLRTSDATSRFPFENVFLEQNGDKLSAAEVITMFSTSVTPERLLRLQKNVLERTFSVVPVLEGLYDAGNIGAVCRSADGLGYGAVHVINKGSRPLKASRGRNSAGAEKWVDLQVWTSTTACFQALRAQGFKVLVTALSPDAIPITQWDWTQPTAFVLGNESTGVSDEALSQADALAIIPMADSMVDSFNVSVAAALILWEARRLRQLSGCHADLTPEQQQTLLALMLLRSRGRVKQGPLVGSSNNLAGEIAATGAAAA